MDRRKRFGFNEGSMKHPPKSETLERTESQNEAIRKHLREGKALTSIDALVLFGCFRLSARIKDLRDRGEPIKSELVNVGDKRCARYYIVVDNLNK